MLKLPDLQAAVLSGIPVLTDEGLYDSCGVRIVFTGRAGGVSAGRFSQLNCSPFVGDDEAAVRENRDRVAQALGAQPETTFIAPNQVHGTRIAVVRDVGEAPDVQKDALSGADGVVVRTPGVAASLNFADCLSLIVVSPSGSFAVAHAGWRGAVEHIAAQATRALARGDGFEPSEYNAYIGPHIHVECFEVGAEVADRFAAEFGEGVVQWGGGALAGKAHVSLLRAVACDLQAAGLASERIADSGICTKCHPERYYSYRATNGRCGRHVAAAYRLLR